MITTRSIWKLALLVPFHCLCVSAQAATTNLVPVADAHLRDISPDENAGAGTFLLVGVSLHGAPTNRTLLRFDLTGFPTSAIVTAATLNLIVVTNGRPTADYNLNRLLTSWSESEATWNSSAASKPWTSGGGGSGTDFVAAPSATAPLDAAGTTNAFASSRVRADVQQWVNDPGTNFGWILLATGEPTATGKQLGSRENPGNEPVLTVSYELPSPPAPPPTLAPVGVVEGQFRFSFNAESNRAYTVEFRDSLTTNDWASLTNLPPQPAAATIQITNAVTSDQRFFRVSTP